MAKDIMAQIEDIQNENRNLKEYQREAQKSIDKLVKLETGLSLKDIENLAQKTAQSSSEFEKKITHYFGLKTEEDKQQFVAVMCNDSSRRFFEKQVEKLEDGAAAEAQG